MEQRKKLRITETRLTTEKWMEWKNKSALDNPLLSRVTHIIKDGGASQERRSTFHQYTVDPREIRLRNQDKDACKLFAAIVLLIAAVAITWSVLYLNKYYKIVKR